MSVPLLKFKPEILLKAQGKNEQGIQAVIFDVDGVLTDGSLYFTEAGETIKAFNVLDGQGISLLKQTEIKIIVITGRDSMPVRKRLTDLGVEHAFFGIKNKLESAEKILSQLKISWENVAVIGDDWPDIPLFKQAAFAVAPPNAHAETKAHADYVTQTFGGHGAVREFCDILLMACGQYVKLFKKYTDVGSK